MNIKITDLADTIWRDGLAESDITTIPEIAYWLRNTGIGTLNNLIHTSFTIDTVTLEIAEDSTFIFTLNEAAVLVQLYMVKFFQQQATNFLGAFGVSDTLEYSENGMTIKKLDRTRLAQVWLALKKEAKADLDKLVSAYKISNSKALSIEGQELALLSSIVPRYNRILNQGL